MPKPVAKTAAAAPETIDTTADAQDTTETKERQPSLALTEAQQGALLKVMRQMRKGAIPGGVTPSAVAAHLKSHPAFADISDRVTPVLVSSRVATLRKRRAALIEAGKIPADSPEVPEFDRQHSEKITPDAFAALLAEE